MGGHGRALWWEGRRAFVGMGNHGRAGGHGEGSLLQNAGKPTFKINLVIDVSDTDFDTK